MFNIVVLVAARYDSLSTKPLLYAAGSTQRVPSQSEEGVCEDGRSSQRLLHRVDGSEDLVHKPRRERVRASMHYH